MRHLLVVAGTEAQGVLVPVAGGVVPAGRVLADVGEALSGCGTQKLQEGQLDHRDRDAVSVYIGELQGGETRRAGHQLHSVQISINPVGSHVRSSLVKPDTGCEHFF